MPRNENQNRACDDGRNRGKGRKDKKIYPKCSRTQGESEGGSVERQILAASSEERREAASTTFQRREKKGNAAWPKVRKKKGKSIAGTKKPYINLECCERMPRKGTEEGAKTMGSLADRAIMTSVRVKEIG